MVDAVRSLTDHHDGHGLNELLVIDTDIPDASGAAHQYTITHEQQDGAITHGKTVGFLQFQQGPRNVEGSTPGITEAVLLTVLIDRLKGFQAGPYPCVENEVQLQHLEEALRLTKQRADERAKRGVLGTNAK